MFLKRMFLGALMAISLTVSAQSPIDALPVKMVNGLSYHYYTVESKETIYSICRKLDISQEELVRLNPSVEDGLKSGQTLYFPMKLNNVTSRVHTVKKKETLYGISQLYGVTTEQLCAWNPGAKDGIKTGQRLIVSEPLTLNSAPKTSAVPTENIPVAVTPEAYIIGQGETLYSIAKAHSTTVDALIAANPGLDCNYYKAGTAIVIPVTSQSSITDPVKTPVAVETPIKVESPLPVTVHPSDSTVFADVNPFVPVDTLDAVQDSVEVTVASTMTIALALPFMLSSEEQSKQAQLYTEFYKGFLLAVDEMRNCGTPINILAYDSSTSAGVSGIINDPKLRSANVIIAPESPVQLSAFGDYGRLNNIKVLNLFVVRDDNYETNPIMLQGNIPHQMMYEKAIDGLLSRIGDRIPVILTRNNGETDKEEYIERLKTRLTSAGKYYKEIFFDGTMKVGSLSDELDSNNQYVFIPSSGKQVELNRVLPSILDFKSKSSVKDPVMIFGYPEWITFRGETLANMHKANTVVFSRFFTAIDDPDAKKVEQQFVNWYGTPMANFMPRQGLFGYDAGMFVINWLRSGSEEPLNWEGVQNGFEFSRIPYGGEVNDKLYFITYRPNGNIDKSTR